MEEMSTVSASIVEVPHLQPSAANKVICLSVTFLDSTFVHVLLFLKITCLSYVSPNFFFPGSDGVGVWNDFPCHASRPFVCAK